MSAQNSTRHPEPSELVYQLFMELSQTARDELDKCEETPDPAEARYKYDVLVSFIDLLESQTQRIPDASERRTCQRQVEALRQECERIAPSIPYICQICHHPWLPEEAPEASLCSNCRSEPETD